MSDRETLVTQKLLTAMGRSPEQVANTQSEEFMFVHELVSQVLLQPGTAWRQAEYLVDLEPKITKVLSLQEIVAALA